jgi:hypothetical protein
MSIRPAPDAAGAGTGVLLTIARIIRSKAPRRKENDEQRTLLGTALHDLSRDWRTLGNAQRLAHSLLASLRLCDFARGMNNAG